MKKIYEKPMVELTKFDVEDIMATSMPAPAPINSASLTLEEKNAIANSAKGVTADAVGVYNW